MRVMGPVRRVFHDVLVVSGHVDRCLPLGVAHGDPAALRLLHLLEVINQRGGLVYGQRFAFGTGFCRLAFGTARWVLTGTLCVDACRSTRMVSS